MMVSTIPGGGARVIEEKVAVKTANKDIGQLSRMLKDVSIRRRFKIREIFKGLRLRGATERSRMPYETQFIQDKLLATGALDGLNEEARHIVYVVAETGMRLSEVVNLWEGRIRLCGKIPYVSVLPDGRRPKSDDSEREIPLVGVALAAMKSRPQGFPRYRDKSAGLSATVNKFLRVNDLRPTRDHSVYSLRHSFKDRLVAEAPDSVIDSLVGHKTYKPARVPRWSSNLNSWKRSLCARRRRARSFVPSSFLNRSSSASSFSYIGTWMSPSSSM